LSKFIDARLTPKSIEVRYDLPRLPINLAEWFSIVLSQSTTLARADLTICAAGIDAWASWPTASRWARCAAYTARSRQLDATAGVQAMFNAKKAVRAPLEKFYSTCECAVDIIDPACPPHHASRQNKSISRTQSTRASGVTSLRNHDEFSHPMPAINRESRYTIIDCLRRELWRVISRPEKQSVK
jgi:hypothetical protein